MSSYSPVPPRLSLNITIPSMPMPLSPKRSSSAGRRQGRAKSLGTPGRSATLPSIPTPRLSAVVSPRLSKLLGDVNKFIDENSTTATSFLSESFMNMSLSNHSLQSHGFSNPRSSGCVRRKDVKPTDICMEDFDHFVSKTLPEFVQDKDLVSMLQYGVQNYLPNSCCQSSLGEIEHYLTTILESTPSLPAAVVADLHSFRGLIQLNNNAGSAIESFTRVLWLQSHMMRVTSDLDNEQEELDRLLDMALTEHRLGVAYGRNGQYIEAIDQMKYAIQSYERAQVSISESCYISAKEDLHEFTEGRQVELLKNSGRAMRRSQLRRCKSIDKTKNQTNPLRRCLSDETRGARRPRRPVTPVVDPEPPAKEEIPIKEVEVASQDSFSN